MAAPVNTIIKTQNFELYGNSNLTEEKVPILVYLKRNAILLLSCTINCHLCVCVRAQSWQTLCNPMDCSCQFSQNN